MTSLQAELERIQETFLEGAGLYRLWDIGRDCKRLAVSFPEDAIRLTILSSAFLALANKMDGEPVPVDEANRVRALLEPDLKRIVALNDTEALRNLASLVAKETAPLSRAL